MILDGWGKSPDPKVSAIDNANIPFINSLYTQYPSAQLRTDGLNVGLPEGQMGNSEVGHMNLGAGRIVYQDLAKINPKLVFLRVTGYGQKGSMALRPGHDLNYISSSGMLNIMNKQG